MAERHKAMLSGDTDVVVRLTADEYVQTDISGYVQDKSAWLNEYFRPLAALIKTGKFRWDTYEEKDVQTRTLGDTAVVVGSINFEGHWSQTERSHVGGIAGDNYRRNVPLHESV